MKELIVVPIDLLRSMLALYPFWLVFFELTTKDEGHTRNKTEAAQLGLIEYHMVETVNLLKEEMGQPPIDHKPVIADFEDRGWEILRLKCRHIILTAVRKLSWLKEIPT